VADEANEDIVIFDEEAGQVYVKVILHPTEIPVYCRVAGQSGGKGEGEWNPFVQGDEVLVIIPQGHERGGCAIIGRMNNQLDAFPMESVAGQDPTTNTFAFRRRRSPFIEEYGGPIIFRQTTTGALFSIDETGAVTIRDGQGAALQISPDAFNYQSKPEGGSKTAPGTPKFVFQVDITGGHFLLRIDDAILSLSSSKGKPEVNALTVPGQMSMSTAGNAPIEHTATTEAVANIIVALLPLLPLPIPGSVNPAAAAALVAAVMTAAGKIPLNPLVTQAIQAAFKAQPPKRLTPGGQNQPGIGCAGLLVG
jgi:hypothetical protein